LSGMVSGVFAGTEKVEEKPEEVKAATNANGAGNKIALEGEKPPVAQPEKKVADSGKPEQGGAGSDKGNRDDAKKPEDITPAKPDMAPPKEEPKKTPTPLVVEQSEYAIDLPKKVGLVAIAPEKLPEALNTAFQEQELKLAGFTSPNVSAKGTYFSLQKPDSSFEIKMIQGFNESPLAKIASAEGVFRFAWHNNEEPPPEAEYLRNCSIRFTDSAGKKKTLFFRTATEGEAIRFSACLGKGNAFKELIVRENLEHPLRIESKKPELKITNLKEWQSFATSDSPLRADLCFAGRFWFSCEAKLDNKRSPEAVHITSQFIGVKLKSPWSDLIPRKLIQQESIYSIDPETLPDQVRFMQVKKADFERAIADTTEKLKAKDVKDKKTLEKTLESDKQSRERLEKEIKQCEDESFKILETWNKLSSQHVDWNLFATLGNNEVRIATSQKQIAEDKPTGQSK